MAMPENNNKNGIKYIFDGEWVRVEAGSLHNKAVKVNNENLRILIARQKKNGKYEPLTIRHDMHEKEYTTGKEEYEVNIFLWIF